MQIILSRKEAIELGLKRYFTGNPCINDHIYDRYVSNSACIKCLRDKINEIRSRDPARNQRRYKRYYGRNKDRFIIRRNMTRNRMKIATPPWVDIDSIRKVYKEAKEKGLHVDHIVPLNGKNVSGLHVENNLQLLTPKLNMSKSNKF